MARGAALVPLSMAHQLIACNPVGMTTTQPADRPTRRAPGPAWRGAGVPAESPRPRTVRIPAGALALPSADATLLDRQVCFSLYRASHALNSVYREILDPYGITYPQYLVMLALWDGDGIPVKELSERVCLDSGTLSPLLRRLTQRGLVRRERDARDERRVDISLTEQGEKLRAHAPEIQTQILSSTGLTAEELFTLRDLSTRLANFCTTHHVAER